MDPGGSQAFGNAGPLSLLFSNSSVVICNANNHSQVLSQDWEIHTLAPQGGMQQHLTVFDAHVVGRGPEKALSLICTHGPIQQSINTTAPVMNQHAAVGKLAL